jgi:Tat protein translocase TatC
MARSTGEMPFLEHLEELRIRILKALGAVVVGVGIGIALVDRLKLVERLQAPILPLLAGKHLVVQSPTEPVMIWLLLGVITGLVLASPVIIWQLWAFLAPALYEKEKKAIVPSLFVGLALFLTGAILSFLYVVPQALKVLLSFQAGAFEILITFDRYFSFVLQVVLAMGLSAELPLVIIVLAALGVVTPAMLKRFRRFAIALSFVAGALLSPGTDVFSMLLMTAPLLVLYEVGVLGAYIIHRRRTRAAAAISAAILFLVLVAQPADAQRPPPRPPPRPAGQQPVGQQPARPAPGDTLGGRPVDTASARRMGLPSAPKLTFPQSDSVIDELLDLEGYEATRYRADTAQVHAIERRVQLESNAMTERSGSTLEASRIGYREGDCRFDAQGEPHLFQENSVVVGDSVNYNTCVERGLVRQGLTSFPQQGANWFIRGNIAIDSSSSRVYASAKEVTSCDLPESHYHFSARELKWVSKSTMVARPAILYIRDVPIAWIPFLFQDTKRGRRSGILIPEFGFNDIVRPSRGYNRTIRNIGYYWAASDYFDALARFDWFANRYTELGFEGQYRWINRFVQGNISFTRSKEIGGSTSSRIVWNHNQTFNNTTRFAVSLDYSTNSRIVLRNTVDPLRATQNIHSRANLNKQFKWGQAAFGFSRSQNISDNSGTQTLPSFTLSPKPLDFGPSVTWSPDLNFSNDLSFGQKNRLVVARGTAGFDTLDVPLSGRVSHFTLQTPLRIGGFNWTNSVSVTDSASTGLREELIRLPNDATPDPTDSITVRRVSNGGFGSSFDWQTGINLPIVFRTTWKLTPGINIVNTTPGDFAVRNARTGGDWVRQGKRLEFRLSMAPTFYGFFGGVGPFSRIRHTISPSLSYAYSPSAAVPQEYARAIARNGSPVELRSRQAQTISLSLNQNFEAKYRPPPGDTSTANVRKIRLLSINTSGLSYDFEQAKLPGRTGWITPSITNSFLSDLVPGFDLSISHDLWKGQVGSDTAKFSPFLSNVSARFALTSQTFTSIGRLLGLVSKGAARDSSQNRQQQPENGFGFPSSANPFGDLRRGSAFTSNQNYTRGQRGFNMNVNYTLTRTRPDLLALNSSTPRTQSNVSLQSSFAPTRFWQVNWTTQYNTTLKRFEAQQLNLTRDLHDWRATFAFSKAPQGNFAFSFLITLIDLPDIKFDYRQTTIQGR